MKPLFLILFLIPVAVFSQKAHTHKPDLSDSAKRAGSGAYDPLLYVDSARIRQNVITYVKQNFLCAVGKEWYSIRQNVDTFSRVRKAKYSNLKYKKQ